MAYFQRCFVRLFHCRTIGRATRVVVGRGHFMPRTLKPLLTVGTRAARRLRLSQRRVGFGQTSDHVDGDNDPAQAGTGWFSRQ
jgi:hypothetical protein